MACIPAVLALIASSIEKKLAAEGTQNDLIELLLNELVTVHFVDFSLSLPNGTLTAETACVKGPLADILFHCEGGKTHSGYDVVSRPYRSLVVNG